jgi:uncharacterized protein (TIGR00297 family)
VLYPVTVLVLLLVFFRRPEVAAAGWGLLAFADGAATLVGRWWGGRHLPWNPAKTWGGFAAYLVSGWAVIVSTLIWLVPGRYSTPGILVVGAIVALLAAFLESAPQRLDDNLRVPILASLVLWCCLEGLSGEGLPVMSNLRGQLALGMAINIVLSLVAVRMATLSPGGGLAAGVIGTAVFGSLGWPGYAVLVGFFVVGTLATRLGREAKERLHVAQEDKGRRQAANAIANGGVAAACALFAVVTPHHSLFVFAFVCSLAAAAADTAESELGQLWGRPTLLITTLEPVAPGTDGGVSLIGSAAGLAAAMLTVSIACAVNLLPAAAIVPLALLAIVATGLESVIGATLERSGWLDNHGVNTANTLLAALLGAAWQGFVG